MKAPERIALSGTGAVSGFAGCGRRPSRSGFNTARQLPLRANEWQLFFSNCNQGGTACDTSLADCCKGLFIWNYSVKHHRCDFANGDAE